MKDVIILGCGIIGAACAYTLSRYKISVTVLEKSNDVDNGTTKANSAIIHAGYDPHPDTEMARLNVEGNRMLEDLGLRLDVPFKRIGSHVLAFSEADLCHLRQLYEREKNGVSGTGTVSVLWIKKTTLLICTPKVRHYWKVRISWVVFSYIIRARSQSAREAVSRLWRQRRGSARFGLPPSFQDP